MYIRSLCAAVILIILGNYFHTRSNIVRVASNSRDQVVVTVLSSTMLDMGVNWILYAKKANLNFNVVALDRQAFHMCYRQAPRKCLAWYDAICPECHTNEAYMRNDQKRFRQFGVDKVNIIIYYLKLYQYVVFSDIDSVFLASPFPHIDPRSDMALVNDIPDISKNGSIDTTINTGIIGFRRSDSLYSFLQEWKIRIGSGKHMENDQTVFNNLVFDRYTPNCSNSACLKHKTLPHKVSTSIYKLTSSNMFVHVLDMFKFLQGHTFFVQRIHHTHNTTPVHVHPTYTNGGEYGKMLRLIQNGLWDVQPVVPTAYRIVGIDKLARNLINHSAFPQRIWHCGKFDQPSSLWNDSRECFHPDLAYTGNFSRDPAVVHLKLSLLNRNILHRAISMAYSQSMALVVPTLWCACDRYWWTVDDCRIPGAKHMALPYVCPLDYLIDVTSWKENRIVSIVGDKRVRQVVDVDVHTLFDHELNKSETMRKMVDQSFTTQYTFCSLIRNPHFPDEKKCAGNPMHDYNDPKFDVSVTTSTAASLLHFGTV